MALTPNPNWRGDPTFLPEVLKAFGVTVKEYSGWRNRGHGDFGIIQGIIAHHTGSNQLPASYIAQHPQLGLCSQIHLDRNGVVTLTGVGIAWHAGRGAYAGWPTNNANQTSIGIEANSDGVSPWPAKQLDAYYRTCAAILWFLGKRATTNTLLGHHEYSGKAQGKWDPGAGNGRSGAVMDMNEFRRKVNAYIDNPPFKKVEQKPVVKPEVKGEPVTNLDTRVAVKNGDNHKVVDLIKWTDERVFELTDVDIPRLEKKLDRCLELLEGK